MEKDSHKPKFWVCPCGVQANPSLATFYLIFQPSTIEIENIISRNYGFAPTGYRKIPASPPSF